MKKNALLLPACPSDLDLFLSDWDFEYRKSVSKINLFNQKLTAQWNADQKIFFAKIFYHARGHFHDFLWFLGNFATDKETKDIVLSNLAEEFNGSARSHEQMYIQFAESVGASLEGEIIDGENYLPFIKEFNKGHLRWLKNHGAAERFSAFSAYERLDNVDYVSLWNLAKTLGISNKNMVFFTVHMRANHFDTTHPKLRILWDQDPEKVRTSYEFIANHQKDMWQKVSDAVFTHKSA